MAVIQRDTGVRETSAAVGSRGFLVDVIRTNGAIRRAKRFDRARTSCERKERRKERKRRADPAISGEENAVLFNLILHVRCRGCYNLVRTRRIKGKAVKRKSEGGSEE